MYYDYDKQAALAADESGQQISERGKYIGHFTRAECVTSQRTGTEGVAFDFVTTEGKRARFTLYTRKSDGETIYGYKQLMSIMTCLQQNGLSEPQPTMARVYDYDAGREVEKTVPQFTELLNKPIGLLLHMEEYRKQDGSIRWRPAMAHAFQANTELMSAEILARKVTPEQLPKVLMTLRDRPLKEETNAAPNPNAPNNYRAAKEGSSLANMDDDIPF